MRITNQTNINYTARTLKLPLEIASDQDCFVPLMEKFYETYGHYPKYPVADAGYGSYNNYLYCEEHGMEKYMKFTLFEKETKSEKYYLNPYRVVNFKRDSEGNMICPNGRKFLFKYNRHNQELTSFHEEVIENLECIHGALLCMNRSIQSEGTFGIIKWDRSYKRLFRRGKENVILELTLISCGYNLYKYHNKKNRISLAA